jgi:phage-related baseplate assembly protein
MAVSLSYETIDLSRLPAPNAIEPLNYETLQSAFMGRFVAIWAAARALDPSLPQYDVQTLETDPTVIVSEAWSYLRLIDRARVNDAVRAVLAPLAKGADLDNVVARVNIERLIVIPATDTTPAVMESDERLLLRYLLAFSRPAAGTRERYLFEAYTALPILHHAAVNGTAIHGRRGDVDIVLAGPDGRDLTNGEMDIVRNRLLADDVKPEAVAVVCLKAQRTLYNFSGALLIAKGPDQTAVTNEAEARIRAAAYDRMKIGDFVPINSLAGAGYGPGVLRASATAPSADIAANPYAIPILDAVSLAAGQQA